jgi:hypothetical protein
MLEIERLKILEGAQTATKVVYAPLDYWGAARISTAQEDALNSK